MKRFRLAAWLAIVAIVLNTSGVYAQSVFKKALMDHLGLKKATSVSCNACHVASKPKTERNDFGKLLEEGLKGKDVSKRLKEATEDQKKAVEAAVTKEFLEVLEKLEMKEYPDGGTYGEALRAGKVEGVKTE